MLQFLLRPEKKGIDTALRHMLIKANWSEFVYRHIHTRKFKREAKSLQPVAFLFRLREQTGGVDQKLDDEKDGDYAVRIKRAAWTLPTAGKIVGENEDSSWELTWGASW
jgi:hypothetical protein